MDNQITCPNCGKVITNNPVVDSAVNKENRGSTFVMCDCGEKISFWAISAQLRDQKTLGHKIKKWFRNLSKSRD
jgi:RNase P subunit RPR2